MTPRSSAVEMALLSARGGRRSISSLSEVEGLRSSDEASRMNDFDILGKNVACLLSYHSSLSPRFLRRLYPVVSLNGFYSLLIRNFIGFDFHSSLLLEERDRDRKLMRELEKKLVEGESLF